MSILYENNNEFKIVHFIVEGIVDNKSQLFYSKKIYDKHRNYIDTHDKGKDFYQITFEGNNKNPKSSVDKNGNLHVVWESDRLGKDQIYYGVIGEDSILYSSFAFSSAIDKSCKNNNMSLFEKDDDYIVFSSEDIFGSDFEWNEFDEESGAIIEYVSNDSVLDDIKITGNPFLHGAMAIAPMKIILEEDLEDPSYGLALNNIYSNLNYQISFDLLLELNQVSYIVSHHFENKLLSELDIDVIYNEWLNDFEPVIDENIYNKKIYVKNDKRYVVGRIDKIYDKVVPLFGAYDFKQEKNSIDSDYKIKILKNDTTLKDFSFGLLMEKSYFKATEVDGSGNEEHIIFTGNAKFVVFIKTIDREDYSDYFIVKEISDSFNIFNSHSFDLIVNYINAKEDIYSCVVTLLDGEKEIFSQSFMSNIDCQYNYFDIAFGFPKGKSYIADKLLPYKMSIYENVDLQVNYSNINISSPSYVVKDNMIYASLVYDFKDYRTRIDNNNNSNNEDQKNEFSLLPQIPITFEGINRSPRIKNGHCNDTSIVWQGNRDRYWNIYTTNSLDSLKYFRYNTKITNTKSNSLMPDMSLDRNGNRMVVWHDNRDNNFSIYSARSIGSYGCNLDLCRKKKADFYKDRIVECYIEFDFESNINGYHNFILSFFSDQNLNNLEYEVDSQYNVDEFYINGSSFSSIGAYEEDDFLGIDMNIGDRIIITYIPINRYEIYDKVLYVTLKEKVI